jgi:hydroxymethylglutaryl-CoA lyase
MSRRIEIVEVGPRDGLQNEARVLPVEDRVRFIGQLEAAGVRRIEAVSFVNPARVPQMAGAEQIMSLLPAPARGGRRIGLVLNEKGWERCVAAGCDEANVVVCASDGFGIRNQGADTDAQIDTLARIMDRSRTEGPPVSATVSVAFGCPFDGEVPEARLTAIIRAMAQTGVGEIALADTIGVADPWTVRRRVEAARAVAPDARLRLHFHDTRRTGLANAYAGVEAGVDVLDASCGGIGGCPFAPNATGNIATEDLVYMLSRAGYDTGLDLDALIAAAHWVAEALGKPTPSALSRAGGFPKPALKASATGV